MAWIESHQTLGGHLKLHRLARALNVHRAQAIGHLHYLWWWALDGAPDGDLSALTPAEVAEMAEWPGKPELFLTALRECGWLDPDGRIHDWHDYAGKLTGLREANRNRQRRRRATSRTGTGPVTRDNTVTSRVRHGAESRVRHAADGPPCHAAESQVRHGALSRAVTGLPNPTQPNQTQPNPTVSVSRAVREHTADTATDTAETATEEQSNPGAAAESLWPTLEEVLRRAEIRGIPRDCAERWWHLNDSRGGLDTHGQPIRRWESSLRAFAESWRAVQFQARTRTDPRPPPAAADHSKGFFHGTPFEDLHADTSPESPS